MRRRKLKKGIIVDVARLDLDTHDFATRANTVLQSSGHMGLSEVVTKTASVVEDTRAALRREP